MNDKRLSKQDILTTLKWVEGKVSDLWEPYEEKSFSGGMETSPEKWTTEYYNTQKVYVKSNFSKKRFLHLLEVREHLG